MPMRVIAFTIALALAALGMTVTAAGLPSSMQPVPAPQVAMLLLVLTIAGTLQLQLQFPDDVDATDLFEVALAPVLLVLSPPAAVVVTEVAKAASQALL